MFASASAPWLGAAIAAGAGADYAMSSVTLAVLAGIAALLLAVQNHQPALGPLPPVRPQPLGASVDSSGWWSLHGGMELDEQLTLFSRYGEDELFTAALQLMHRIYDEVVYGDEDPVHGDLEAAIDNLRLGPWRELDKPLVEAWPYSLQCALLELLVRRLEDVTSSSRGLEAVLSVRWLLGPSAIHLWANG